MAPPSGPRVVSPRPPVARHSQSMAREVARPTFPIRQPKRLTVALKLPGFARFPLTRSSRSMPGKAAKTIITERQQEILQTFSRSVTAPSRLRQRALIIVLAFNGLLNEEIAQRVGLTQHQVGCW